MIKSFFLNFFSIIILVVYFAGCQTLRNPAQDSRQIENKNQSKTVASSKKLNDVKENKIIENSLDLRKTIIFDFDGTICDSYVAVIEAYNSLAPVYHFKKISSSQYSSFKNSDFQSYMKSLKINSVKQQEIILKVSKQVQSKLHQLKPFKGIDQAFHEIRMQGHKIGILTSHSEKSLKKFLKKYHLEFDFVYGNADFFNKSLVIQKIMIDQKIPVSQIIYVGDETRDIEFAQKAGIPVVAVDWGFQSSQVLQTFNPDWLIHSPSELMSAIEFE